jgi:predicted Zn-dependent protease
MTGTPGARTDPQGAPVREVSAAEPDAAAVADRVLELATRVDGAEADVHVTASSQALTRFALSFVHQNVVESGVAVRLRVALDGRSATASTNRVDDAALDRLVRSTVEAARLLPVDPGYPGMAPPAPAATGGNWDEATAGATPDDRAAVVGEFVEALHGLQAAGYVETSTERAVYANTAGQRLSGAWTLATVDGIARTPTSDGVARRSSIRLADLSGAEAGAAAAANARAAAEPTDLEPGDYEVVLAPDCVADVLQFLAYYGFSGRAVAEGRSFAEIGTAQFDQALQLWDDATDLLAPSLPYDLDGTPRRRLDLVVDGVTSAILHDRRTAAAAGTVSTGHATAGGERWGPVPTDLRLATGGGGTAADLARQVRRGLLVEDFWYTRILDPRTTVVTGLTRNGVWLFEDGEVVRPVRNLRFTQSYVDALRPGAVLGIGSVAAARANRWTSGVYAVPPLHLASWHFTGGAAG